MASLKKAIERKCKDCTYDQSSPGTWREQTESCTVTACALWEVRPISIHGRAARRAGSVAETGRIGMVLANLEDDEDDTRE